MIAGQIKTRRNFYIVEKKKVKPRDMIMRDAFKLGNWLNMWARGKGGKIQALGQFRRFAEDRVLNLNLHGMRMPIEVDLWDTGFWITPENAPPIVNLYAKAGSRFRISGVQKKMIRKSILFAREYSTADQPFIIEMPLCWTIKHPKEILVSGKAGTKTAKWEYRDPRAKAKGKGYLQGVEAEKAVNQWNEHYLAHLGMYIRELRDKGGGSGKSRVDPGPIPIMFEAANEYETMLGKWTDDQLGNIMSRWRNRDTPTKEGGPNGEMLGISTGGPMLWNNKTKRAELAPYPPIQPRLKIRRSSDIRIHPARDKEIPWDDVGTWLDRQNYPNVPIFINEPMMLMPAKAYDKLPKGHGWRFYGTKDAERFFGMCDDILDRNAYLTIHDGGSEVHREQGGGMSALWVPKGMEGKGTTEPGVIDAMIREWAA